jgi:hypothetical protein
LFDLRVLRSDLPLCANGFSGILAMPEQEGSIVTIKYRLRKFSQPLRPEGEAMLPYGHDFCIDIYRFRHWGNHPRSYPGGRVFSSIATDFIKDNTRACPRRAPCQGAAKQAAAHDGDVGERHR